MTRFRMALGALALAALAFGISRGFAAEEKAPGKDVKCPVSGKAVDASKTVDFNGGKVYFCCENCPKAFAKDTKKFTTKANHQMAQTGQIVQTACPKTKKAVTAGTEIEVAGVKVGFCCNNCKGAVAKLSEDKQLETCFADVSKTFKAAEKK